MSTMQASELSRNELEMWENPGVSRVWVTKLDARGQRRTEMVGANRKFHISPLERRMNQELAISEKLDIFRNGTLRPVRLIEGSEDAAEIAANPNLIAEDEMVTMLKGHHKTFDKKLGEITNLGALERMLAMAEDPKVDCSVSRVQAVRDRIVAISPKQVEEVSTQGGDPVGGGVARPVTTR